MLVSSKSPKYVQETLIISKDCIYQSVCVCACVFVAITIKQLKPMNLRRSGRDIGGIGRKRKEKKDINSLLIYDILKISKCK